MTFKASRRGALSERLKTITELLEALLLMDGEIRLARPEAEGLLLALDDVAGQIVGLDAPGKALIEAHSEAAFKAPGETLPGASLDASSAGPAAKSRSSGLAYAARSAPMAAASRRFNAVDNVIFPKAFLRVPGVTPVRR